MRNQGLSVVPMNVTDVRNGSHYRQVRQILTRPNVYGSGIRRRQDFHQLRFRIVNVTEVRDERKFVVYVLSVAAAV